MLKRRAFVLGCACCIAAAAAPRQVLAQNGGAPSAPPLSVAPLADNIWRHTSWKLLENRQPFPSSGLIVKGGRAVLIIDTTWPIEDMAPLLERAREIAGDLPMRIAVTHAHDDRMSGLEVARGLGVRSLAYELTQADAPLRGLPLADETWRGRSTRLDLGGRVVELFYPGPAHTRDNVVAYVRDAAALFGGCQVRSAGSASLGNTADAEIAEWPTAARRLIARYGRRAQLVVPGHGEPGGADLLRHTLDLAEAAVARAG